VALIYYNRGVGLSLQKRYHEALHTYFRAMSLDSEFASAVTNALAVLANWGAELARAEKFEDALLVLATGLELAPTDAALRHNHKAVWSAYAETEMKAGNDAKALAILQRALAEVPGESAHFLRMQAWVQIRRGEERVRAGQWEQAAALIDPG